MRKGRGGIKTSIHAVKELCDKVIDESHPSTILNFSIIVVVKFEATPYLYNKLRASHLTLSLC